MSWISSPTGGATWVQDGTIQTTTGPYYTTQSSDWRDGEIIRLRQELTNKETALREAYLEIGSLHEQVRGMQAFDKFSENLKKAQP